jgi:hypothetical protein
MASSSGTKYIVVIFLSVVFHSLSLTSSSTPRENISTIHSTLNNYYSSSIPFVPCDCALPQGDTKCDSNSLRCAVLDDTTNTGKRSLSKIELNVDGLTTIRGYVNKQEQKELLNELLDYEFFPYAGKSCQEFGQNFSFYIENPTSDFLPQNVRKLSDRLIKDGVLKEEERPNYVLVNLYSPGQGIHPHIDDEYYTDGIVSITLLSGAAIEFSRDHLNPYYKEHPELEETYKKNNYLECGTGYFEPGSLFAMHGESRYAYKHEIKRRESDRAVYARKTKTGAIKVHHVKNRSRRLRIALTFRHVKNKVIGMMHREGRLNVHNLSIAQRANLIS